MTALRSFLCAGLLALPLSALAQFAFMPVKAFPERPAADGPFLLLIEDRWNDACGGSLELDAQSDEIIVTATLASPLLGAACAQVVVPFRSLLNPRAAAPDVDFGEAVTVIYRFDAGNGPVERARIGVSFGSEPPAATAQTGGWISDALPSSGFFVDQQGDVMTVLVADYDEDGVGTWHYAAGRLNGSAFSAPAQRFGEIVCITASCPRAAPLSEGRIDIAINARDELLVAFEGVLLSGRYDESEAYRYRRLDFERDPALAVSDLPLPDLAGTWVAGVPGVDGDPGGFGSVDIIFEGIEETAIPRHVFRASPRLGEDGPSFTIVCTDDRPVDGTLGCSIDDFAYGTENCVTDRFAFEAVGHERLSVPASCDAAFTFETRLELFRLD
ncbi:MAG: hypothetical protein AAGE01_04645 [Pseudomonadota bacterium]